MSATMLGLEILGFKESQETCGRVVVIFCYEEN